MSIKNKLLGNIYFGTELNKLLLGTEATKKRLKNLREFSCFDGEEWEKIRRIVLDCFRNPIKGAFGGPVTAGDCYFIAAYMAAVRPSTMVEVGVCSGVSSYFILYAAEKLGLLQKGKKFLYSFDLLRLYEEQELEVGRVVRMNRPELLEYWSLNVETTSVDIKFNEEKIKNCLTSETPVLAFIDAEHKHPWPMLDTVVLSQLMPEGSWLLLQDVQVMERWLANCVEVGVPSARPCRGVNLISTLWPGTKVVGWDMCYNMAAIKTDTDQDRLRAFVRDCMSYPPEVDETEAVECDRIISRLGFDTHL